MYDQYYGFREEPFRLSPDHTFAFQHRGYKKARAYMAYAFMRAEGFVMVTGRPGTGKTTLVGALVEDLARERVHTANLVCSQLQADDLLKMVAYEFGVDIKICDKGSLLQHLSRQLQKWHREGRRALLIVDEAQDLSVSAMEELRLLTNIQVNGKPLLQIFLLGQPELRELILSPPLEQVHQRIVAASHLQPLEADETEAYIRHRLISVGWNGDPAISKAVYPLVFKSSEGVPRRINLICSRLLLHGSVEDLHRIGAADVRTVVEELQSESLAVAAHFTEEDFQVEDEFEVGPQSVPETLDDHGRLTVTSSSGETDTPLPNEQATTWRRRMRRQNRIF
ncbi:ExeA family protein [Congregibacter sp.]|jgi:general secretion pathway protein A|uniref:ExeA family protein n=1 Tax=Congregibacter sp. TaxID=2744308 RepID=UPI0039E2A3A4